MTQALLVMDVQRGLFDPSPQPFEAEAVVKRINTLTDRARRGADVPGVCIQHERPEGFLAHGSESWQLARGLLSAAFDARICEHPNATLPDIVSLGPVIRAVPSGALGCG